jgi:SAM-dependent methyltransferase
VSLASDYGRQFAWRDWQTLFDALPLARGQTVLDLGCAVGDQAAELVARGARVIGVDMNEDLLREARSRGLRDAEFRLGDLRSSGDQGVVADGVWSSFTAAYFPDLPAVLASWTRNLRQGGWIALTEVDDLFGHEPLEERARSLLESYARDALQAGRYDFHMGRKLRAHLERAGLTVVKELMVEDRELSFAGPAGPDVLEGWRARFERMKLLRDLCGPQFEWLREEFLGCLTRADHRSLAKVRCCIARR